MSQNNQHQQAWMWASAPSVASNLAELNLKERKLLGSKALAVGSLICWAIGHEKRRARLGFGWLHQKTGINRRTLERVVKRLRECGAFTVTYHRKSMHVVPIESAGAVQEGEMIWGTEVWFEPRGVFWDGPCGVRAALPKDAWRAWSEGRKPQGRPIKDAGCTVANPLIPRGEKNKDAGYNIHTSYTVTSLLSEENGVTGVPLSFQEPQTQNPKSLPTDKKAVLARLDEVVRRPRIGRDLSTKTGPRLPADYAPIVPEMSRPARTHLGHSLLSPLMPTVALVGALLEAYRNAHSKIYGTQAMQFSRGDVTRSKHYPALLRCAQALLEHEIAPGSWCEWRMGYLKSKGLPAMLTRICSATTVEKQHGFFVRSYDGAGVKVHYERVHSEQLFRAQEIGLIVRLGGLLPGFTLWPKWYCDMRREEVARGELDPMYNWPVPAPVSNVRY